LLCFLLCCRISIKKNCKYLSHIDRFSTIDFVFNPTSYLMLVFNL
jgi:hypothetical protein